MAGNGRQIGLQIVGALFVIGWNIVWTSLIMCFIKFVCRVPLRMTDEMCEIGDYAVHGEEPYTFEYYNRSYRRIAGYEHPGKLTDEEKAIRELRKSKEYHRDPNSSDDGVIMGTDPTNGRSSMDVHPTKDGKTE